jgi:PadR family transcriptional regulator PadR
LTQYYTSYSIRSDEINGKPCTGGRKIAIQAAGILLDGCVLSLLARGDAYGYSLTQQLKSTLGVSESTLYPVMRRLQVDGCLSVYDAPHNGRNRRYYQITSRGLGKYESFQGEWREFKRQMDEILTRGSVQ